MGSESCNSILCTSLVDATQPNRVQSKQAYLSVSFVKFLMKVIHIV